jgi:AraC-like DNA-binding protein
MSLENVILIILSGLGVFHGVFFAFILWNSKTVPHISNRLLSILLLMLSIRIGKSVALAFSENLEIIYIYLGLCLLLFIGPLYYLYSRSLIKKVSALQVADLIHFTPAVFFILLAIPFQVFGFKRIPNLITALVFLIFYGHFLSYLIFVKVTHLRQNGISVPGKELKSWLNTLFYGLVLIWLVYVLNLFEERIPYIIGPIVYSLTVYTITYVAISRKYLTAVNTVKYSTTSISEEEIDALFKRIESAVYGEKMFLQPDLSLAFLAKRFKTSPQKVSLVINSRAGCNFNEYVNRFRIVYAIELLTKPEGRLLTIAAIGTDVGFHSLSSFNQAFKKITGKTPSAYRNVTS